MTKTIYIQYIDDIKSCLSRLTEDTWAAGSLDMAGVVTRMKLPIGTYFAPDIYHCRDVT